MPKLKPNFRAIPERARRAAGGTMPPAGVEAGALTDAGPDGRHRRAIRQRLRRTRAVRRARLSELGLLTAEMQARGRWNNELVDEWVRELEGHAAELRGLDQALRGDVDLDDLIDRRVVAECGACGRLGGGTEAFCAGCGRELPKRATAPRKETSPQNTLAGDLTTIQPPA